MAQEEKNIEETRITHAMIKAGVSALLPWYGLEPGEPRELRDEAVVAVYEAMEEARLAKLLHPDCGSQ